MSSEGSSAPSTLSRIRQFGLYRTIDARTEEFLKSSRKRQIRQGCACAAVSTAITVTVVVSVILVYEYSINGRSSTNKIESIKPNWIGLMNDSTDIMLLDSKFTKKINFDKTTLKLLPILLRALNKNKYLEKILDDFSTSSPAYERKLTTEFILKKNIFSDKNNWAKLPTTKLYTTEYKSLPMVIKIPSTNSDYLEKRKIRDYKRILNYFEKMIIDKVGYSQLLLNKENEPLNDQAPIIKSSRNESLNKINRLASILTNNSQFERETPVTVLFKNITENKKEQSGCKCPKNLGNMLSKLIVVLKAMIPNVTDNSQTFDDNKTEHSTVSISETQNLLMTSPLLKILNERSKAISVTPKYEMNKNISSLPVKLFNTISINKGLKNIPSSTDTLLPFRAQPITSSFPNNTFSTYGVNYNYNQITSPRVVNYTVYESIEDMTLPLQPQSPANSKPISLEKYIETSTESLATFLDIRNDETEIFDQYELNVNKLTTNINVQQITEKNSSANKGNNYSKTTLSNFRKLGYLTQNSKESITKKPRYSKLKEIKHIIHFKTEKKNNTHIMNKIKLNLTKPENTILNYFNKNKVNFKNYVLNSKVLDSTKLTNSIKSSTRSKNDSLETSSDNALKQDVSSLMNLDALSEIDIDKILSEEEYQDDFNFKKAELSLDAPLKFNKTFSEYLDTLYVTHNEKKYSRSMLPVIRPVHLEIQRNDDWKHDDADHDYNDDRFRNNGFDLINI